MSLETAENFMIQKDNISMNVVPGHQRIHSSYFEAEKMKT